MTSLNEHQISSDHLDRFYSTARFLRDGRKAECPFLAANDFSAIAFTPEPWVQRMWDETQSLPKLSYAIEEAVRARPRESVFEQILAAEQLSDLPRKVSSKNRNTAVRDIRWAGRSLEDLVKFLGWRKTRNNLQRIAWAITHWDRVSPQGRCFDREYTTTNWRRARYGLGWLYDDHIGHLMYGAGNLQLVRQTVHDIVYSSQSADFRHHHDDGYDWSAAAIMLHADTFGKHSLELLLDQQND